MAYDVTALANYTKQEVTPLLVKSVLASKTIALIKAFGTVMTGIKSAQKINYMDTDAVFQNGAGCGFTPSGATAFTQREVTVGKIKVNEALCPADLESKYTQMALTAGSDYDAIAFATEYSDLKAAKIAEALEVAVWSGDTGSVNANLNKFDGFRKIIKAASGVVDGNTGNVTVTTGITKTNVEAILDAMIDATPAAIRDKALVIFAGWEVYRNYVKAMRDKNLFHAEVDGASGGDITIVGSNVKLISTPGLNGTNEMYMLEIKNMAYGTDLLGEEDEFSLTYAPEAEEVRFKAKFKAGVQVLFPAEIVKFELDAA